MTLLTLLAHYGFWLAIVSLGCVVIERIWPWREQAPLWRRPQWLQDVVWFVFNGYLLHYALGWLFAAINGGLDQAYAALAAGVTPKQVKLLATLPLWGQVLVAFVAADFLEWCVHNVLHRVPPLWRIHRVHHSIQQMDWIGNFRFHFGEVIVYQTVKHVPLALLGASGVAMLIAAVVSTLIGHINHANVNVSWGPLRYLLNSPRMHIWHHDKSPANKVGYNFGIALSVWDWIFRTAYLPETSPEAIGFNGEENVPDGLVWRFLAPFIDRAGARAAR